MTKKYLGAYTGPTPPTGYVGYVNISLSDAGVVFTVRPESELGCGTAATTVPVKDAILMLETVLRHLQLGDKT